MKRVFYSSLTPLQRKLERLSLESLSKDNGSILKCPDDRKEAESEKTSTIGVYVNWHCCRIS